MSVIELKDVSVTFHEGGRTVEAVKHVTLNVDKGEIFGIVGFPVPANPRWYVPSTCWNAPPADKSSLTAMTSQG